MITLKPQPLTVDAFAPFGQVISTADIEPLIINQGFAQRYNTSAIIDVAMDGGEPCISIFSAKLRPMPIAIRMMERHPLGSQLFMPLQDRPWLIVVCTDPRDPFSFKAFAATGQQGINYNRNTWHHPLLALDPNSRFLIIDRKGTGNNLEEAEVGADLQLAI